METTSNFKSYLLGKYGSSNLGKKIILARRKKYHTRIYNSYLTWTSSFACDQPREIVLQRYKAAITSWHALRLIIRLAASNWAASYWFILRSHCSPFSHDIVSTRPWQLQLQSIGNTPNNPSLRNLGSIPFIFAITIRPPSFPSIQTFFFEQCNFLFFNYPASWVVLIAFQSSFLWSGCIRTWSLSTVL